MGGAIGEKVAKCRNSDAVFSCGSLWRKLSSPPITTNQRGRSAFVHESVCRKPPVQQLEAAFAEHGTVLRAQVVSDRETGRSRGFGFVEMETDAAAQAAITAFNDQDYNGRRLSVNVARERSR